MVYGTVDVALIRCGKVQLTLDLREGESSGGGAGWGLEAESIVFYYRIDGFDSISGWGLEAGCVVLFTHGLGTG